jgi:hypothetical protein
MRLLQWAAPHIRPGTLVTAAPQKLNFSDALTADSLTNPPTRSFALSSQRASIPRHILSTTVHVFMKH